MFAAEEAKRYTAVHCVDEDFIGGARKAQRPGAGGSFTAPLFERRIAKVLTIGANWAGPIGDFRLTVDKGRPDSLVSFCANGVKTTGPTTFEVRHAKIIPARDLNVLILYRPPNRD